MSIQGARGLMTGLAFSRMPYLDPFTEAQLLVIEEALCAAWSDVLVARRGEVPRTFLLVRSLNRLLDDERVPGYDLALCSVATRGSEMPDHTHEYLEKRPDITLHPMGRKPLGADRDNWALFIECKVVGPKHSAATYCKDGLMRFVDGRYAWAVSIGMMLGYAEDGHALPDTLVEHFQEDDAPGYAQISEIEAVGSPSNAWTTEHDRDFVHPGNVDSGPIRIRHLWLSEN